MNRKIKVLCLTMAALFAFSAISAAGASATEKYFHSAAHTTTITASKDKDHVFTTNAGTVTCTTAHFTGEATGTTVQDLNMSINYNNCTAFGFVNVPIEENGCTYTFTSHTTNDVTGLTENLKVHLLCPGSSTIEIKAPFCTTKVGPQTLEGFTPTNLNNPTTGKKDVTLHIAVSGIAYNECGTNRTNGTYHGSSTIEGTDHLGNYLDVWYTDAV